MVNGQLSKPICFGRKEGIRVEKAEKKVRKVKETEAISDQE